MAARYTLTWRDATGATCTTAFDAMDDSGAGGIATAIAGASGCQLVSVSAYYRADTGTGFGDTFAGFTYGARLNFRSVGTGRVVPLLIPAAGPQLFLADGKTVDPSRVRNLTNALQDAAGNAVTYEGGFATPVQIQRTEWYPE